jgi:hypothetical protein
LPRSPHSFSQIPHNVGEAAPVSVGEFGQYFRSRAVEREPKGFGNDAVLIWEIWLRNCIFSVDGHLFPPRDLPSLRIQEM